jgi:hypothetical protein
MVVGVAWDHWCGKKRSGLDYPGLTGGDDEWSCLNEDGDWGGMCGSYHLEPSTTYYVRFRLEDSDGNESWSPETPVTPDEPPALATFAAPVVLPLDPDPNNREPIQAITVAMPSMPESYVGLEDDLGVEFITYIFDGPGQTSSMRDSWWNEESAGLERDFVQKCRNPGYEHSSHWNNTCRHVSSSQAWEGVALDPGTTYYVRFYFSDVWGREVWSPETAFTID